MKRSPLGPGKKALARGSSFASKPSPLKRTGTPPKRRPISEASPEQRAKAERCIVTGSDRFEATIDAAHLASRAHGGCDDPLCVVPLRRDVHELFDRGEFDLQPYLLAHGLVEEIAHALVHYRGDLLGLASRLTGTRWQPVEGRMAA